MMLDYPEIMNKLTLLIGAGMTVKKAWEKIVQDYERQKDSMGVRYAYEEMAVAYREMRSGLTETESYERFGRRCGLKAYRRLAGLLEQNLRKGTKGLTALLGIESRQAFEERRGLQKDGGRGRNQAVSADVFDVGNGACNCNYSCIFINSDVVERKELYGENIMENKRNRIKDKSDSGGQTGNRGS